MPYFIMLVLHDPERLDEIVTNWEDAGVSGVTILASTGIGRIRQKTLLREDLPLIPSLNELLCDPHEELLNRTLFTIVHGESMVDRIVQATEKILGDLNQPNTGILSVFPLARVYGLKNR